MLLVLVVHIIGFQAREDLPAFLGDLAERLEPAIVLKEIARVHVGDTGQSGQHPIGIYLVDS